MVGSFPPPVHGMAAVNMAVHSQLQMMGNDPLVINLAALSLDRNFWARLGRFPRVLRGLTCLIRMRRLEGGVLYMSISGGLGQVYEILFLLLARLRRMRVYLHHHSFAYLDQQSWLTWVLVAVAGSACTHITLSSGMAARLQAQYSCVHRGFPISNVVFFSNYWSSPVSVRLCLKTIGFISNISAEKGIFEFLDLVALCEEAGLHLRARLAGPFQDSETESKVRQQLEKLHTVEYVGPQYEDDKRLFFDSIDVLIFPTRYVNEAEPLTIHEAMQRALPVITYGRGCIPEMLGPQFGLVVDAAVPFAPAALVQIKQWVDSPDLYRMASRLASERFAVAYLESMNRWQDLLREIFGSDTDLRILS
jgi:glycosyltransferase involved in cell wall biosynthesis